MATLILSQVGGALGASVGGTLGYRIGSGIGTYLGGSIDSSLFSKKTKLPDVAGQRLETLNVQVSTYGKTIPHVYGYARMAGNVIWSLPIKEVESRTTTTSGGGKGGGGGGSVSQTSIAYKYYATLAIAIAEGEVNDFIRVWADAKALSGEDLQAAQGKFEIFYGTEDQMPSAIMESYEGAGNVPAYRGTAYVVIEDFPLEQYGNRIPNFSFEIQRKVKFIPSVEDKIKSVMMIPGSGEFVYARDLVQKYEVVEDEDGNFHQTSEMRDINRHTYEGKPDLEVAIDQMLDTLPNLEWVGLVVSWFANSKHAADCEIFPKVEYHETSATTSPVQWSVAGLNRNDAPLILYFPDGSPTYGGSPTDKSVVETAAYLQSKGLKVMFYPFLMVDTLDTMSGEDNKPWRGRIVPATSGDVTAFFTRTNGYNRFIRHYSQLSVGGTALKNVIDAFIIGSEMVGLTSFDAGSHTFPAVTAFKTLAGNVRSDLSGTSVLIGYAADWTEYHSTGGYYNMDPLWTDSNIDFVGIDAYFPITPDLPQSQITEANIMEYWEKGEGWDYYYSDPVNRTGLTSYGGDPTYAWKNVENWWNSAHTNPGGGGATGWTAKMKPVWFTEYGFPSVDCCANQPNVFYDPSSVESFFPRTSRGRIDFQAQRQALNATEDYLEARNQESGNANLIPHRFVWTWDARPFPFYPDLRSVWADWQLYPTGHWINGKLGGSTLGAIIAQLLQRVGLFPSDYDVSRLTQTVEGFIIDTQTTCRDALELLKMAYMFDMVESEGLLKFIPRGGISVETIDENLLLPVDSGEIREHMEITRAQELDMPNRVNISYIARTSDYQAATQFSQRQTVRAKEIISLSFPNVMGDQYAKQIADISLYTAWISRITYNFRLPPKYAALEPADIITVTVNNVDHVMRIVTATMERNGAQQIAAVAEDVSTYDFYTPPGESPIGEGQGVAIPETDLYLLDLPAMPFDTGTDGIMRAACVALGDNWPGTALFRSADGGESGGNNFSQIASTSTKAIKGVVLNTVGAWTGGNVFDTANTLDVALISGSLASVNDLAILNGANVALIGNEIIQFQTATLTGDRRYTLSNLLRGRLGTEHESVTHAPGADFILLDSSLLSVTMPPSTFGLLRHYKAVTLGGMLANTDEQAFTYRGITLRPYSPVWIEGARDVSDNITLTWVRRTRIAGEWRDGVDVPLSEENERYEVDIMDGADVVRTISSSSATCSYSAAEQTTDFGAPQSSITVKIYQLSTIYGRGVGGEATV